MTKPVRILLIGSGGQVGGEILRLGWPVPVDIVASVRAQLDIAHPMQVTALLKEGMFDVAINCAAYTAVDKAETDVEVAWRLNAVWPAVLASETGRLGIPIVQVSTDYVFDGSKPDPYLESDPIRPLNVYGSSKAGGEQAVRVGNERHAILRTSWVISPFRANFAKTMLRLAGERDSLRVVADQYGAPTIAADLADAIGRIALRLARGDALYGTWHFANSGFCSWADLAEALMAGARKRGMPAVPVERIPGTAYPTPARRPANSRLSTELLQQDWQIKPRHWNDALESVLDGVLKQPA